MEIAGDLRLREQSLHGIYALFGDDGGGHSRTGNCVWREGGKRGWTRRASGIRDGAETGGPRAEGGWPRVPGLRDVSLHGTPRGGHQPRILPFERRRARMEDEAGPDQELFAMADRAKVFG